LTSSFDIEEGPLFHGKVTRELISLALKYDYYDAEGNFQGIARRRIFTIGNIFDISDRDGKNLGIVDEKILSLFHTFDIYNEKGQWILRASLNFWGTTFTFTDPSGKVLATISRPFINLLKDIWTAHITETSEMASIDPRLFTIVPIFRTDLKKLEKTNKSMAIPNKKSIEKERQLLKNWTALMNAELKEVIPNEEDFYVVSERTSQLLNNYNPNPKLSLKEKELLAIEDLIKNLDVVTTDSRELKAFILLMDNKLDQLKN
jgi:uncharacterized protein YxjI